MDARLSVGLIGLGEVAQLMHLPLLADDPRFRIAAVSDVSPSLTAHIGDRYGVAHRHATAAELITDPAVDAVFILTPDHLHAELLEATIGAGKHAFIEKPACLTAAELRPLIELDRDNDKIVFVGDGGPILGRWQNDATAFDNSGSGWLTLRTRPYAVSNDASPMVIKNTSLMRAFHSTQESARLWLAGGNSQNAMWTDFPAANLLDNYLTQMPNGILTSQGLA